MDKEMSPLLPEGTSIQAWASGLADKEHNKVGKPISGVKKKQKAQGKQISK